MKRKWKRILNIDLAVVASQRLERAVHDRNKSELPMGK